MATQIQPFVISREFNAPRDLVWKAWTDRDRLMAWFGPKSSKMTIATLDFRVGGTFHYGLAFQGVELFGKWIFKEITPTTKIVLHSGFADAQGNFARHPMQPVWPLEMLSTTTLDETDGKTTVTVRWEPLNASDAEIKAFNDLHASMVGGWGGTFDQLAEYLFNIQ